MISAKMRGEIVGSDVDRSLTVLHTMDLVGVLSELDRFLARLGRDVAGVPFHVRHENATDKAILTLSDEDGRRVMSRFLAADATVYERAVRIASATDTWSSAPRSANASRRVGIAALIRRYRQRTVREYANQLRRKTRVALRSILEMFLIATRNVR